MPNGMQIWEFLAEIRITETFIENPTENRYYAKEYGAGSESVKALRVFSVEQINFY